MKKIVLLALSLFLMLGILGGSNQNGKVIETQKTANTKKDVREVVLGQLPLQQKIRLNGNWKDGKVLKIIVNKVMMDEIEDKSYGGKVVYLIDYPTKDQFKPNNVAVYADVDTYKYIGNALVE